MAMASENNANLTPIHVNSFNVNGLGQEAKQNAIFKKLKQKNSIILRQENHSTLQIEKIETSMRCGDHFPQEGGFLSYFQEI